MIGAATTFFAAPARLKALVIGALVMLAVCLALTTWAFAERSGRLSIKVDLVEAQASVRAWEQAAGRCTASIENAAKIGQQAVDDTRAALKRIEAANAKNAPMLAHIAGIVSKPPPARADGSSKDCGDAWGEIRSKVKP